MGTLQSRVAEPNLADNTDKPPTSLGAIEQEEEEEEEEEFRRPRPSKILHNLYLSDYRAAANTQYLSKLGITHILNVKESMSYTNRDDHSIVRMHVSVSDFGTSQLERDVFPACFKFIETAHNKKQGIVLVHCSGGVNRSPTVVIGYLMCHRGMTMLEAYNHVVKCRPKSLPHPEYLQQLSDMDAKLHNGVRSMPKEKFPKSLQEIFQELEHATAAADEKG
eukprot:TRINITY_DN23172_c0_g3_i1.p1 TRINITY_DN23172_c0_g3~~TRINITY_DN23172_c0_g3_i1.p1  ORF type:complete len:221 (-),score=46.48 TRINITY_DN23172_c0_g3_i1:127-789(-)